MVGGFQILPGLNEVSQLQRLHAFGGFFVGLGRDLACIA